MKLILELLYNKIKFLANLFIFYEINIFLSILYYFDSCILWSALLWDLSKCLIHSQLRSFMLTEIPISNNMYDLKKQIDQIESELNEFIDLPVQIFLNW